MSYDVAIWKSVEPLEPKAAVEIYKALDASEDALEKTAKRKDRAAWVEHYAKRRAKGDDLAKTWAAVTR